MCTSKRGTALHPSATLNFLHQGRPLVSALRSNSRRRGGAPGPFPTKQGLFLLRCFSCMRARCLNLIRGGLDHLLRFRPAQHPPCGFMASGVSCCCSCGKLQSPAPLWLALHHDGLALELGLEKCKVSALEDRQSCACCFLRSFSLTRFLNA